MIGSPEALMARALRLARRGRGLVSPNPMVGAVIARNGRVVAEGWHHRVGGDHAEVDALKKAGPAARDANLFVNLEPCCHFGRTPPCTRALLEAGLRRVFVAHQDPNPLVAGQGIAMLRRAGVEVQVGLLEAEARELNAPFLTWITQGRPFVTLKMAVTLDGRVADRDGRSRWVTSEESRREVHRLRSWHDAVMVGAGTAVRDDPLLLATMVRPRSRLVRIVVDAEGRTPLDSRLLGSLDRGPAWIALAAGAARAEAYRERGAEVLDLPAAGEGVDLSALLHALGKREVTSLLVEGGPTLARGLLAAGLVDRVLLFVAPRLLADSRAPTWVADLGIRDLESTLRFQVTGTRRVGPDVCIELRPAPANQSGQGDPARADPC